MKNDEGISCRPRLSVSIIHTYATPCECEIVVDHLTRVHGLYPCRII